MQDEVFLKFACEALNCTAPNHINLNWTMQCQMMACITKSSCVDKHEGRVGIKLTNKTLFFLCHLIFKAA